MASIQAGLFVCYHTNNHLNTCMQVTLVQRALSSTWLSNRRFCGHWLLVGRINLSHQMHKVTTEEGRYAHMIHWPGVCAYAVQAEWA